MAEHNLLKKLSIGIASLALICPLAMSGLNTDVNARRRRPRTHRVYRHHRKATRRRRGRRAKRTRKARRSHRRVARKATRITKAHKARRTHKHEAETTPVYHESQAQWYKNNGARLFRENINNNITFKKGINDAGAGIGVPSSIPNLYQSNNNSNSTYKHGWIDGDVLGQDTTGPKIYALGGSHYQQLRAVPKSYYKNALIDWNNGMNYLSTHPNASNIYLSGNGNGNNGYWVKSDN